GIRNKPGTIIKNVGKLCSIGVFSRTYRTTDEAIEKANALIDAGTPAAACVDMFYMNYLPSFMHVHAPFHFIMLVGRDAGSYAVSDPYSEEIGILSEEDLRSAWETHAPMAKDNLLVHISSVPEQIDWKDAVRRAISRTCRDMLLPPVLRSIFSFVGIEGIRTYAKSIRRWPATYRGVVMREGVLFDAVAFEAQGTGGGAFRLMYGAFLQEASALFGSDALDELAGRMIEDGEGWREVSRRLVAVGKTLPLDDDAYDDWLSANRKDLEEGLQEVALLVDERAGVEAVLFRDLRHVASGL
ncbi:MAG: BtrH N-terminal domain-containing protein, partial [Deltaproteobacteria bacterium]|nr:BtrH N-terminal domain-containing protein [Deltaproteobacteria bacterium]